MPYTRPTLPFRATGAALVAAAVFLLAPGRASAACGDYVTIAGQDYRVMQSDQTDHNPAVPARPCHGPGCSQRPDTPVAPLTAPVTASAQPKDCTIRPAEDDTPAGPGHLIPFSSSGRPARSPSAIFHPPRAL